MVLGGSGLAGIDVADLEPVQTVYLAMEGELVTVQTDTGAKGVGYDLKEALRDLQDTTSGFIFLETADYLLVVLQQECMIPQMEQILRPSCRVCLVTGQPDLEKATVFLKIHSPQVVMKDYLLGQQRLQTLQAGEEMRLVS